MVVVALGAGCDDRRDREVTVIRHHDHDHRDDHNRDRYRRDDDHHERNREGAARNPDRTARPDLRDRD